MINERIWNLIFVLGPMAVSAWLFLKRREAQAEALRREEAEESMDKLPWKPPWLLIAAPVVIQVGGFIWLILAALHIAGSY